MTREEDVSVDCADTAGGQIAGYYPVVRSASVERGKNGLWRNQREVSELILVGGGGALVECATDRWWHLGRGGDQRSDHQAARWAARRRVCAGRSLTVGRPQTPIR